MRIATLLLLSLAVGCGSTRQTYSVSIENRAAEPQLVWLTKNGPPMEKGWFSPEQVAINGLDRDEKVPGALVMPGKTISRSNVQGNFDSNTDAVLRIYRGERKFAELLAIPVDSPNRTDLILLPGQNDVIIDASGQASLKSRNR